MSESFESPFEAPPPHPVQPPIDLPKDVICPGAKNLLPGDGMHYLRLVFSAYWNDTPPSTEIFYITMHKFHLTIKALGKLEDEILALMKEHDTPPPLSVTYVTYCGIELTDDDIADLDWRVISG